MEEEKHDGVFTHHEDIDKSHRDVDGHLICPAELAGLSAEEYSRLSRTATLKMDLVIMPCLVIMYILNYLDRQSIASAKLANIEKDLNMSDVDYQTSFAFRTAILYSGSQLGNAFGGLFAIGILELDGEHGIEGWRWLFLVEGVLTIGLAIAFAFILPNSNQKVLGLTALETKWVQWNLESDLGQQDNAEEGTAWKGLIMAIRDPKTWLFTGILYSTYIVGTVSNFFPTVVSGLGYDRNKTYGLTAPPFILCVICMLINGFHSDKTKERFYHIIGPLAITLIANIIAVSTLNIAARYLAMMLLPASFYAASIVILSWITGSLSQPAIKRASAIAFINSLCNTPNIWGSYLYYSSPRYLTAFVVNVAASALAIAFAVVSRIYLGRQNSKLDRGVPVGKSGPTDAQIANGFRYIL
ncbi:hypothetical protein Plec18167_005408 [Paecilomyces lecythidis]|uniref:Uncharacterized protein n=1 Tax=Paecilomyces lecythidis TaxID=3004212 RepID=A0ABR3XJJ4_9EURO